LQIMTKFEVMVMKLGDYMKEVFTYLYDDVTENSFFQTASTHVACDLRTNDTGYMHKIHSRTRQVAKEASVFVRMHTAFIHCIRSPSHKVTRSILYQSLNSAGG
jgi:hypothetical protein